MKQFIRHFLGLGLAAITSVAAFAQEKPQTPQPPYPYQSEDVIYNNADKSMTYGATITIPEGKGPFPAVLLITGSGQQNRDEELMGHKPFAVLADHLTKNGYIVLRVDDQGVGKTTGDPKTATSQDFANDVVQGVNYLKSRKEVDKKRIGLYGHSEGGMIAPMVAKSNKDIDFIILAAGPGVPVVQLMEEQNVAVLKSMGMKEDFVNGYGRLNKRLNTIIATANSKEAAEKQMTDAVTAWADTMDKNMVMMTTGITGEESTKARFVGEFVKLYDIPWYRYFISYNPQPVLESLNTKVLAINGEKDMQVVASSNLAGIETALKKSKSTYTVKELEGLNHLFQECKACTVQEYGQLEQTMSPKALDVITAWLDENVKNKK